MSGFAVVLSEASENRLPVGDIDMVRSVVPDKHRVPIEIDRVKFGETPPDFEPVHDEHRHARFQVVFAAHREPRPREKRVADNQVRHQFAGAGFRSRFEVVGKPVEIFGVNEFFKSHRGFGADGEISLGQFFRDRIRNRVGRIEEFEDFPFLCFKVRFGNVPVKRLHFRRFALDDMRAERGGNRRRVGVHIEHRFEHMPQMADPRAAQIMQNTRNTAPAVEFPLDDRIVVEHADNDIRSRPAHPNCDTGKFRHAAQIVVTQLHIGCSAPVIHRRKGLEDNQHDRNIHFAKDRADGRRGGIGDHIDEDQVGIGGLEFRNQLAGALGVVDHSEIGDIDLPFPQIRTEFVPFLFELFVEAFKLFPVNIVTDCENGDVRGKRLEARNLFDFCHTCPSFSGNAFGCITLRRGRPFPAPAEESRRRQGDTGSPKRARPRRTRNGRRSVRFRYWRTSRRSYRPCR